MRGSRQLHPQDLSVSRSSAPGPQHRPPAARWRTAPSTTPPKPPRRQLHRRCRHRPPHPPPPWPGQARTVHRRRSIPLPPAPRARPAPYRHMTRPPEPLPPAVRQSAACQPSCGTPPGPPSDPPCPWIRIPGPPGASRSAGTCPARPARGAHHGARADHAAVEAAHRAVLRQSAHPMPQLPMLRAPTPNRPAHAAAARRGTGRGGEECVDVALSKIKNGEALQCPHYLTWALL